MINRPNRPGLGYVISIALAGVLALVGAIACYELTKYSMSHHLPSPIIADVAVATGTCLVLTVVLVTNYLAQVRVLDRIDFHARSLSLAAHRIEGDVRGLKDDTGQIPRLADSVVDAPEIVIVHQAERRYEQVDRDVLQRLLESAKQAQDAKLDRSEYWNVYSDVLTDLGGLGGGEPPTEPPAVTQ